MGKRVLVVARDLFFRAKLQAVVESAGAEVVEGEASCDVAVVELDPAAIERIRGLVGRGVVVLAFGSHVQPDALRAARALGARAVPNSEVERALRAFF